MTKYQFDHTWQHERDRLASLEQFEDPGTIRQFEAVGVAAGWSCLEIGAGGGSIAAWLCERVGETGQVLATDLETKFVSTLEYPNLEVQQHNVVNDPLPEAAFDLIHERGVLIHLPEPYEVLKRLARSLKPGGWLVCEDTDFVTMTNSSPYPAVREVGAAMIRFLATLGADLNYGRRLYTDVRALGLEEIHAEGRIYMMLGGHPSSVLPRHTFERIRAQMVASGDVTDEDINEAQAILNDPATAMLSPIMVAARGRLPA